MDDRPIPIRQGDEKAMLQSFLMFQRATIVYKCQGLSEEQLRSRPTVSELSLIGLVKHLAYVERKWFQGVMDDRIVDIPWHNGVNEFEIGPEETSESLIGFYAAECAISDEIIAQYQIDDMATWFASKKDRRSLRWIVAHMIEETARHCGHADIIRETIDGATGE